MKKHWNAKVSKVRGDEWKKKLRDGKLDSKLHPSAIYKARIEKDMTQEDVASKIGMKLSTYGSIERAKRQVKADKAKKIASILKMETVKLFKKQSDDKFIAK